MVSYSLRSKKDSQTFEQQLFVSSFYCYLNCDPKNDFVIDLDDVWKWLGFTLKSSAKTLLEKQYTIDKDYKLLLRLQPKQTTKIRGGHNKENFMLTVKTFKSFCLKAGTKKYNMNIQFILCCSKWNIGFPETKEGS
jgi:hypothetical protein